MAIDTTRPTQTHVIDFTLDDEPQTTTERILTPTAILRNAKPHPLDPATHYLIQIVGHEQISYKDKPNEEIHMHEHMKFVSESTGPTGVS
jgi:hypothetical protein